MRVGSFEFSLRELAGSMGDLGTLLPLTIGYVTVCGMDPSGLLVMMGLANVATGLLYRLPMPIEPMKVLAVMAIAQQWRPQKTYTAGFALGLVWLLMGATGTMDRLARRVPETVVRGVQLSLGALLAVKGAQMASSWCLLAAVSLGLAISLRRSPHAPAAVVLVAVGVLIMALRGDLAAVSGVRFSLPPVTGIDLRFLWPAMRDGGLAQIPLTATNAVIATSVLIARYWPERRVAERQLCLNMGIMNVVLPFFGGMPLCHGAGGLAAQYCFGARTGGANLIEGVIEVALGLLLAGSIATLFGAFPMAIVGVMLLMVAVELGKLARQLTFDRSLVPVVATVAGSLALNMAAGFAAGLLTHYLAVHRSGRHA